MLYDVHSSLADYLRGAILVLSLYQLLFYVQNRNKLFLIYSIYFLLHFFFFLSPEIASENVKKYVIFSYPSVQMLTFVLYASFARELLNTKEKIPKWDEYIVKFQYLMLATIPVFIILLLLYGNDEQVYFFYFLCPFISIFAIIYYIRFLKMKTFITSFFVLGSWLYLISANISVVLHYLNNPNYINPFYPIYFGIVIEAVIFSALIGYKFRKIEERKNEVQNRIEQIKENVAKNYITLSDKTKVYISELFYIKSDDHYVNFFLSDGKNHFVRGKLSRIKEELPPNFIQCHRSYIVNSNSIKQVNSSTITLLDKTQIPLSRSFKNKF